MPIHERSFRIGCGRYIQGENYIISGSADEISRLGKYPLIIGDTTALTLTRDALTESLSKRSNNYEFWTHDGSCNDEQAKEIADKKNEIGYDVIVGVGGGVIMDFAKLCGHFAKCPVLNIPTSSATCAAYTPLSVRYTPEGRTVGTMHFDYEVNAVLVDTSLIARQPVRLFLAGVFDAIAKFVEIKQRFKEDDIMEYPLGLDYAYTLSKQTYHLLTRDVAGCIEDMQKGIITKRLENVIFTSIATTGVISGIARGSNQCALAHKFYETTRVLFQETAKPYLHGEIVGVGLLLQNFFNEEVENNDSLLALMKKHHMPYRITDIGITSDEATMEEYYTRLKASSAIDENNEEECIKLRESLKYLWSIR